MGAAGICVSVRTQERAGTKKAIAVIATGPSLTVEDARTAAEVCDEVIAVNDAWRYCEADAIYAADPDWWDYHIGDVARDFDGECISQHLNWPKKNPNPYGLTIYHCKTDASGLSRDPDVVHSGGNSGYQAINVALHHGATEIVLLGFDMQWTGGKSHVFGHHPEGLKNADPSRFVPAFRTIKPAVYGLTITNCSRASAVDAFPRQTIEDWSHARRPARADKAA